MNLLLMLMLFAAGTATVLFLLTALSLDAPVSNENRLRGLADSSRATAPGRVASTPVNRRVEAPFRERIVKPSLAGLAALGESLGLAGDARLIVDKIDRAGRPKILGATIGVKDYVALKVVSIVLAGVVFGLLWRYPLATGLPYVLMMGLITLMIAMAPTLVLDRMGETRKAQIQRSLSDVLDLLVVSAEAGLSLDAAISRVCQSRRGPISQEFEIALQEMRLGKSRAEGLRDLARRTGTLEMKMFASAIIQAELLGVGIAQVLRTQADAHRLRRSQAVREQAAKLPVKMIFPMVLFIFPALFIVVAYSGMTTLMQALNSGSVK